jgi:pentatricopeptide repeat protein
LKNTPKGKLAEATYCAVIDYYCKQGNEHKARTTLKEMQEDQNARPSLEAYTSILTIFVEFV